MRIALVIVGMLVVVVLVVLVTGYTLPVKHRAQREAEIPASPATVFAIITDVDRFPSWRPSVKHVESLPPTSGKPRFRETGGNGAILYEVEASHSPDRLVTRIADPSLPFGGTWTYELHPSRAGTLLRITEDGEVHNPIFRFMSRYVFGHTATLDTYLGDLKAHGAGRHSFRQ